MTKEQKFYNALKDIFVGAKVEGESGYINLMRIKSKYYEEGVFPKIKKDIEEALTPFPEFREELFDKLYTFFNRYFSESGSIYFSYTPIHQNVYEKVYTDDRDVILFWKTRMLYYVKSDRLFKNLEIEMDGFKFFFDVSALEHKKAFEKREIVYEFKEKRKDDTLVFNVYYSEKGRKTRIDEILKALKKIRVKITEDVLDRAFRVFERQSEVDYFINQNARKFLREQFDIWLYQYVFSGESEWTEKRIKQLQTLRDIAFKIIGFISQFEGELVKIWNKPKFVLNSNYVITLDRLAEKDIEIVEKILRHKNFDEQLKEWKELGIVTDTFSKNKILETTLSGKQLSKKYQCLPIDTRYFKDLELEILGLFENLDEALDGWLIKSENYQALNTILPKFNEKVQMIYIDPPFNKEKDADYFYSVKYKDSSWVTLLENRLQIAKDVLRDTGNIYVKCDYNGNMFVRLLMNEVFGSDNFRSELVWKRFTGTKIQFQHFAIVTDTIYCYSKTDKWLYDQQYKPYKEKYVKSFFKYEDEKGKYCLRNFYSEGDGPPRKFFGKLIPPPKGHHWRYSQENIDQLIHKGRIVLDRKGFPKLKMYLNEMKGKPYDNLLDEMHVVQGSSRESWGFSTQNPEKLLQLLIESSSNPNDLILDFFLGSSTTTSVAHKLDRKWIGIEMGDHFYTVALPRMKEVLAARGNHEPCGVSKEVKWQGGGFFKYYDLEQYEDTLRNAKYEDSDIFENPYEDPYNQYVFMKDLKMLETLKINYEKNKVKVDLSKLYQNIDVPETISNLLGKWTKKITPTYVEFEDGEKIDIKYLDYKLIKPLIWW